MTVIASIGLLIVAIRLLTQQKRFNRYEHSSRAALMPCTLDLVAIRQTRLLLLYLLLLDVGIGSILDCFPFSGKVGKIFMSFCQAYAQHILFPQAGMGDVFFSSFLCVAHMTPA